MPLAAESITFAYRTERPVLRGVSATFPPGTLTAVLGPNGSGKSTLLRTLLGILAPQSGRVILDGRDAHEISARRRAAVIAYVPQHTSLAFAFTVREVVRLGRFAVGPSEPAVGTAIERLGLADRSEDLVGELSAGQQQRVTLARVLAQLDGQPTRVVLADEPISAMDPRHALDAMDLLRSQAGEGLVVVVVLHDFSLAARFADRVLLLNGDGSVAAHGPTREVLTPAVLTPVFGVDFLRLDGPGGAAALVPTLARSDARISP